MNTKNTHTIYVLYQDENMTIPWINIGFWEDRQLWANIMYHHSWHFLGSIHTKDLFEWTHICLDIDMVKETISASINGNKFGVTNVSGINPSVDIAFNIRLGIVHTSGGKSKHQFHGKITNIQLLQPIVGDIANLTKSLCFDRTNISILSWSDMKWTFSGNDFKEIEKDSSLICPTSIYADLIVPLKWTKSRAVDMCRYLGNGIIASFPSNTSIFNRLKGVNVCRRYWSPYSYSLVDGIVINENTLLEEELLWSSGFPVNITDSSNVIFFPEERHYINKNEDMEECLICNTSLKTEYTMRGNCKYSFLGNFKYKTNTFNNKYLGFFGGRVAIW